MNPSDLLAVARALTQVDPKKPTAAFLRRAISTAYYALFHFMANQCADLVTGTNRNSRSNEAWRQVYRALQHGELRAKCEEKKKVMPRFPQEIQNFANQVVAMQIKRHQADYDPFARFTKSSVVLDINICDRAIADFSKAKAADRRAFCIWVLLKDRKD